MHTLNDSFLPLAELKKQHLAEMEEVRNFEATFLTPMEGRQWQTAPPMHSPAYLDDHGLSTHISIRMPSDVLRAFKDEALRRGVGYQTLIIQALRVAMGKPGFL